ncbi:adenylosuccinate lyase [Flavobacteriales bacterium]|nr:adenylosuccinate lyase [Flavobacteriales bacterium]
MDLNDLTAISPIDGRYRRVGKLVAPYFSEFALIKYRVQVEIEYFIALCELPLPQLQNVADTEYNNLRQIYLEFSLADASRIKEIERTTNHDVKAVEYFIKEELDKMNFQGNKEFIHFGLTSQDINNTAVPLSIKEAIDQVFSPQLESLVELLTQLAVEWQDVSMLARTHGQPASPTKLGKEIFVFAERLNKQLDQLGQIHFSAKFGGATGNFNAHHAAYPEFDWVAFANEFIAGPLGLTRTQTTTQIEHYDNIAALCDCMKRINTILIDLDRDIWSYVSMDYFKQKIKAGEIGSSAMPHKVNPIDFENSEGNLGIANALFEHLSAKLPISRLQRDLTDSTVLRNIGVPIGHSLLAFISTIKGLNKLVLNESQLKIDLEDNWAVVAEAIQTVLRREGYPNPYEALKELTRTNNKITENSIANFINQLDISEAVKSELRLFSPHNYTGIKLV